MSDFTGVLAIVNGHQEFLPHLDMGGTRVLAESADPETIPIGGYAIYVTNDAINGQTVHVVSRGSAASLLDTLSALGFVARDIGAVGNSITVEYVKPSSEESLSVAVVGEAITVTLGTAGAATFAALTTALGGTNKDLTFIAKTAGVSGNGISVEYDPPITDTVVTVVSAIGDAVTVALAGTVPSAATAVLEFFGTGRHIKLSLKTGATTFYPSGVINIEATDNDRFAVQFTALIGSNLQLTPKDNNTGDYGSGTWYVMGSFALGVTTLQEVVDAWNTFSLTAAFALAEVAAGSNGANVISAVPSNGTMSGQFTGGDGAVPASITTDLGSNKDVKYTSTLVGALGNGYKIEETGNFGDWGDIGWYLFDGDLHLRIATVPGKTAAEVVAWAAGNPAGAGNESGRNLHDYVTVALAPGSDGSGVWSAWNTTGSQLTSGGVNAPSTTLTSTAAAVKTAIEADTDSDALVAVTLAPGNDGSGLVTQYGPENLIDGHDINEVLSFASDVQTAIEADTDASALVAVYLENDQLLEAISATTLAGGDDDSVFQGQIQTV